MKLHYNFFRRSFLAACCLLANSAATAIAAEPALPQRAWAESAVPVRPGRAGGQPFWNKNAVQFLYAPSFDFPAVPGAKSYRYTIVPATGATLSFVAAQPWESLAPVWQELGTGPAELSVVGLDETGAEVGPKAVRSFHRAAAFVGDAAPPAATWDASANAALTALVHSPDLKCWFTTGVPDEKFDLYRYPSKIVGAAAAALAIYAQQKSPQGDAAEALAAARRAADYLLGISLPKTSPWADHPPTYHPTMFAHRMHGHMQPENYLTLCGAETGEYYLEVFAATGDAKYRDAAVRIAETYAKRQLPEGSWPLFVTIADGRPAADNVLIPTVVINFLERLDRTLGDERFVTVRDRALNWTLQNPVRTWNWQGQFEDVKPLPPYENLTKHDACNLAIYLFNTQADDRDGAALAVDLLRFSEDQFVMWANPPTSLPLKQNDDGVNGAKSRRWFLPCVVEQYRCYAPVCASSAKLLRTYLAAYRATRDPLHLAKAKSLAAVLVQTQANPKAPNRYQTWVMKNPGAMWFNCELMAVQAMLELSRLEDGESK